MDERSTSASASDPTLSAHDGGFRTHPGDAAHSSSLTADLAPAALTTTPLTRPGLAGLTAPPPTGEPRPAGTVDPVEAEAFLRQFFAENPSAGNPEPRVREVLATIDETGTYSHTSAELAHGARVAWRNSSRCIGRLYWRSLVVRDRRHVGTATGVFHESVEHLRLATNGGRIRPMITVFAPQEPDQPGPRIWNEQLIRYAGTARRTAASSVTPGTPGSPTPSPAWAGRATAGASTSCRW
jgi:hypothetical protein